MLGGVRKHGLVRGRVQKGWPPPLRDLAVTSPDIWSKSCISVHLDDKASVKVFGLRPVASVLQAQSKIKFMVDSLF